MLCRSSASSAAGCVISSAAGVSFGVVITQMRSELTSSTLAARQRGRRVPDTRVTAIDTPYAPCRNAK